MTFNTAVFNRSHGKQPRGVGSWGFVDYAFERRADYLSFVFWFNGSYTEAKKAARAHFANVAGFSGEVVVLP